MSKVFQKLNEKFGANCVRPHFEGIAKKENGITLIALIITIIVMLILTGVTLAVTLGDNGLMAKANETKIQMQIETDKEELLSAVVGAIGIDGKVDFTYLDSHLPAGFTGSNGIYTSSNGHTFTVSANGKVKYTGSDDVIENGGEIEKVGFLDGTYNWDSGTDGGQIQVKNNIVIWDEGIDCKVAEINTEAQTVTWLLSFIDEETGEYEEFYDLRDYRIIYENGEIVNIIFEIGSVVCHQNNNAFENELDELYVSESGSALMFYPEEGNVVKGSVDGSGNFGGHETGKYYSILSINTWIDYESGYIETVSDDFNTITRDGTTYTKQTETEEPEVEIIPYETTVQFSYDGTEENMATWVVVSVDETARTMEIVLPRGIEAFTIGKTDPIAIENAVDLDGDNVVEDFEIAIYSWNHFPEYVDTFFEHFSANLPSNAKSYETNFTINYYESEPFGGDLSEYDILNYYFSSNYWDYFSYENLDEDIYWTQSGYTSGSKGSYGFEFVNAMAGPTWGYGPGVCSFIVISGDSSGSGGQECDAKLITLFPTVTITY